MSTDSKRESKKLTLTPGFYTHYKKTIPLDGSKTVEENDWEFVYEVLGVGFRTEERGMIDVVYRPLYPSYIYQRMSEIGCPVFDLRPLDKSVSNSTDNSSSRPSDNFLTPVDGKQRFTLITDKKIIELCRDRVYYMYVSDVTTKTVD